MKNKPFTTSEVRSGFLVFITLIALLGLIFMSGSIQMWREQYELKLRFNYISGLQKNAPVHVAGLQVGKVTDIRLAGPNEPGVIVTASVSKDVILKKDAEAYLNVAGFMGEMFIELFSGSKDAPRLNPGEELRGTDPVPMMELVKKGSQLIEKFEKIANSMENLVGDLKDMAGTNKEDITVIVKNIEATTGNLKEMTADLKKHPWKLIRKGKEDEEGQKKKKYFLFF
jgi:phospholipid/cholesterol/gamma-HCH transport system substrate-binding protein